MRNLHAAAFAFLFLFTACSRHIPVVTVAVIDTSLSITPRAEKAALEAVLNQISQLGRGDSLVLIPITGDAANDAGGRVLRLTVPTRREAYDSDLHRFQEQAGKQFAAWVASLDKHQSRTDIFGALDAARQDLNSLPKESNRKLIVVTDFLEDDGVHDFVRDLALTNPARARELASHLRAERGFELPGVALCLGRLESSDFAPLAQDRKDAVQAFWIAYFTDNGQHPEIHFDGTGMLADIEHGCTATN